MYSGWKLVWHHVCFNECVLVYVKDFKTQGIFLNLGNQTVHQQANGAGRRSPLCSPTVSAQGPAPVFSIWGPPASGSTPRRLTLGICDMENILPPILSGCLRIWGDNIYSSCLSWCYLLGMEVILQRLCKQVFSKSMSPQSLFVLLPPRHKDKRLFGFFIWLEFW